MLEVRLLGQFDVRLDGQPVVIASRPAQSLLAYLLLNPHTARRHERLAGLLRPDTTGADSRSNLRVTLLRLRMQSGQARPTWLFRSCCRGVLKLAWCHAPGAARLGRCERWPRG